MKEIQDAINSKIKRNTTLIIVFTLCSIFFSYSQDLPKIKNNNKNVLFTYGEISKFDGSITLELYKGGRFKYEKTCLSGRNFSEGDWKLIKGELVLNSYLDSTIAIKLIYDQGVDSIRWRNTSFMQVPKDLCERRLSNARIYLNDTASYCFPFFDTCIGSVSDLKNVMVDFSNGYKSQWISVNEKKYKQLQVIAMTEYNLSEFIVFKNKRYKKFKKLIKELPN